MATFTRFTGAFAILAVSAALLPGSAAAAAQTEPVPAVKVKAETDQLIVKVKAGQDINAIAAKHGAKFKKALSNSGYKTLKVPAGKAQEVLTRLLADPHVEAAELDEILYADVTTPNDPAYPSQYHLPKIQANYAWDYCRGSSSTRIAILDTGIDLLHPDLAAKIVPGYDFVNSDSIADDDHGHGTHVAGTATALTNNSSHGAGVDWNARLMPVKVLDSTGAGYTSDIISGVYYAADNGASIINMSLGGSSYSAAFQDVVNYAWNRGVVIVAAAGNNGNTTVTYPAAYTNVLSVAATTSTDAKASFSSYGTWVDIAAPGQNIYSTAKGGGMITMSGSSMAAPIVAGVAGLVKGRPGYSTASPSMIVYKITSTADAISGTGSYWVYGRVNAYKACTQ
ncbi:thermitase [Tumebacillus sp. BK434]|uniref:S8 family peptidase n=1 Tax=Tumebacillus sp. BK434 TaxID=2512169 RepID=UPI001049274C|nr:S8 family peptidase [Tumebacillus sp. BK434]TCP59168.1 thermitase [Tumebacillus sp. BK434]